MCFLWILVCVYNGETFLQALKNKITKPSVKISKTVAVVKNWFSNTSLKQTQKPKPMSVSYSILM